MSELEFQNVEPSDTAGIRALSALASSIVKEHYDPIIGAEQNDYQIAKFQSAQALTEQLARGYRYYFCVLGEGEPIGFLAFYPREDDLYISKFYLKKEFRGRGFGRAMLRFVIENARRAGRKVIRLNVNRNNAGSIRAYEAMGFQRAAEEKNGIGNGYFMDDYVYAYDLTQYRGEEERNA